MKKQFQLLLLGLMLPSPVIASTSFNIQPKLHQLINSPVSHAQTQDDRKNNSWKNSWIISIRAGSLGIGPEIMYHPKYSHWGVRGGFYTYNFGLNNVYHSNSHIHTTYDGYPATGYLNGEYSGNVQLLSGSLLGDYYPWRHSAFRITSGIVINKNNISFGGDYSANGTVSGVINQTITREVYGHEISKNVSVPFSKNINEPNVGYAKGTGKYNPIAPYIGIGFNTAIGGGFYVNGDLGAMFQTYNRVNIHPTGTMTAYNGYEKGIKEAHDKIHHYMGYAVPAYPVAMIGIGYRF